MTHSIPFSSGIYPILDAVWLQQHMQEENWPMDERVRLVRDMEIAGIRSVQLRCKNSPEQCAAFCERWLGILRAEMEDCRIIINDHIHLTLSLKADGVHVGQGDTTITECRALLGPDHIIGLSTHNRVEIEDAQATTVDYIGFGPLFKTNSKPDTQPLCGLEGLQTAVGYSQKPVVAIGGVQPENLFDIACRGVHAVAMISGLWGTGGRFLVGHCVREFDRGQKYRSANPTL